jgi:hypothetical protein
MRDFHHLGWRGRAEELISFLFSGHNFERELEFVLHLEGSAANGYPDFFLIANT